MLSKMRKSLRQKTAPQEKKASLTLPSKYCSFHFGGRHGNFDSFVMAGLTTCYVIMEKKEAMERAASVEV